MTSIIQDVEVTVSYTDKELSEGVQKSKKDLEGLGDTAEKTGKKANESLSFKDGLKGIKKINASLLAFTATATGVTAAISALTSEGLRINAIASGFEALNKSVGLEAEQTLLDLRRATQGAVSDLELFEQASSAALLGLPLGQLDELTEAAALLGQTLGIGTTAALESLTVGLGRGSKLVLDNLGVIVDTTAAYEDFARTVGLSVDELTEAEKKLAFQQAAIDRIRESAQELKDQGVEPVVDAYAQFTTTIVNNTRQALQSLATNQQLQNSLKQLFTVGDNGVITFQGLTRELNLFALGITAIANQIKTDLGSAITVLNDVGIATQAFVNILRGADFDIVGTAAQNNLRSLQAQNEAFRQTQKDAQAAAAKVLQFSVAADELARLGDDAFESEKTLSKLGLTAEQVSQKGFTAMANTARQAADAIIEQNGAATALSDALIVQADKFDDLAAKRLRAEQDLVRSTEETKKAQEDAIATAEKLAQERERLAAQTVQSFQSTERYKEVIEDLNKGFTTAEDASSSLSVEFETYKQAVDDARVATERLNNAVLSGGDTADAIQGVLQANQALERISAARDAGDKEAEAYGESFTSSLNQILGSNFSLEDIQGGIGNIGDFLGEDLSGVSDFIGSELGAQVGAGVSAGFDSALEAIDLASQIGGIDRNAFQNGEVDFDLKLDQKGEAFDSLNTSILEALSAAFLGDGGVVGGFIGDLLDETDIGATIADSFGLGDSKGTAARKAIDAFFADAFDANRVSLIIDGELKEIEDLQFTGLQNLEGGVFDGLDSDTQTLFEGVGRSIESLFGNLEGLGVNLGRVFAENLGGDLNNLQILLRQTGINADQAREAIIGTFTAGDISAVEAATSLQQIDEVFRAGIPGAIGDTQQALDNLIASGARGLPAIDALQDLGAEGLEGGIQSLQELEQQLLASGQNTEADVRQLFATIREIGIQELSELQNITEEQGIQILASLETSSFGFEQVVQDIENVRATIESLPDEIVTRFRADTSELDAAAQRLQDLQSNAGNFSSEALA